MGTCILSINANILSYVGLSDKCAMEQEECLTATNDHFNPLWEHMGVFKTINPAEWASLCS